MQETYGTISPEIFFISFLLTKVCFTLNICMSPMLNAKKIWVACFAIDALFGPWRVVKQDDMCWQY